MQQVDLYTNSNKPVADFFCMYVAYSEDSRQQVGDSVANHGTTFLILQQKQNKYIETPKTRGLIFSNMLLSLDQRTLAALLRGRNITKKILLLSTTAQ